MIYTIPVEVLHEITVRMNFNSFTMIPLLLLIVPVIVTVYLPVKVGLNHDIILDVAAVVVIKAVLYPLSDIIELVKTMFDSVHYDVPVI